MIKNRYFFACFFRTGFGYIVFPGREELPSDRIISTAYSSSNYLLFPKENSIVP